MSSQRVAEPTFSWQDGRPNTPWWGEPKVPKYFFNYSIFILSCDCPYFIWGCGHLWARPRNINPPKNQSLFKIHYSFFFKPCDIPMALKPAERFVSFWSMLQTAEIWWPKLILVFLVECLDWYLVICLHKDTVGGVHLQIISNHDSNSVHIRNDLLHMVQRPITTKIMNCNMRLMKCSLIQL